MPKIHKGEKYFTIPEVTKTLKITRKKTDELLAKGILEIAQLPRHTRMMVTAKSVAKAHAVISNEQQSKPVRKKTVKKESNKPLSKGNWSEILHLSYVQANIWEEWVCDHPVIQLDKDLQKRAEKICEDMNDLYQEIGRKA